MMKIALVLTAALLVCTAAADTVLDDFEYAAPGNWVRVNYGSNNNFTTNALSAHGGTLGGHFMGQSVPDFYYRTDITSSPGSPPYYAFLRFNQSNNGRFYFGVGATASGAIGATACLNTSELKVESYLPWGYNTLSTVPYTFTVGTWYRLGVKWDTNGDMTSMLWDETGTTSLASSGPTATGLTTAGGFSMRSWSGSTATNYISFDDISVIPEPASLLLLALGGLALRRR